MSNKIRYCSEEFLTSFKAKFEVKYLPLYLEENKEEIQKLFADEYLLTGDLDFEYVDLYVTTDFVEKNRYFIENVKRVYSMFRDLSPTQATKEEFWFVMINTYFLDYLLDEIDLIVTKDNPQRKIENMLYFLNGQMRSLVIQRLAKYWWIGYRTYDESNLENPYWLTEFYCQKDASGKSVSFFSSKLTNNKEYTLGVIEAIKILVDDEKVKNDKYIYAFINKHFNYVGGVRIIDIMTREQFKNEALELINEILEGKQEISETDRKRIIL